MKVGSYTIGKYKIEIFSEPKFYIDKEYQDCLVYECAEVARNSFGNPAIEIDDVRKHILETSISLFVRDELGDIAAFSTSSVKKIDDYYIIYLQSGVISKKHSGKGLYYLLIALRIFEEVEKIRTVDQTVSDPNILIAGRTQSPLGYRMMHRKLGLYPDPTGRCDEHMKDMAEKLAREIYAGEESFPSKTVFAFDRDHFILKRAYRSVSGAQEMGVNLYDENIPFCKNDDEIDDYMRHYLDWRNGDGLISMGPYCYDKVNSMYSQAQQHLTGSHTKVA